MTSASKQSARNGQNFRETAIFRAQLALFWEKCWPAALPALAIPYLFLIFILVGGMQWVPLWARVIALGAGAALFSLIMFRRFREIRWPSRDRGQARLEEDGNVAHASVRALDDVPFAGSDDPLWRAHMQANAKRAKAARLNGVRKSGDDGDPWGLRWTAAGALVVAFIMAGDAWRDRLAGILSPDQNGVLIADAWIEPPDYTPRAPIYLLRAGEPVARTGDGEQIDVPEGSVLIVQTNGRRPPRLDLTTRDGVTRSETDQNDAAVRTTLTLTQSGLARLQWRGEVRSWPIGVISDLAPTVVFTAEPASNEKALLALQYAVDDDYGVVEGVLRIRLDPDHERPLDAPSFDDGALAEERILPLPGAAGATGERVSSLDLQSDPWAGLPVLVQADVIDGAGQHGFSDVVATTLPARLFFNPLAKTVIEQRQTLAVAVKDWPRVGRSLDAVTLAPDVFFSDASEYLMLRTAYWRVMRQDGEGFDEAIEKFWPLALTLEDEALELARQRLQAAEEALRQALENDASDKEIERLVEDLRQAMNDFITALAQSGTPPPSAAGGDTQQLGNNDLEEMLNSIQDLSETGAKNAARQLLSDLENILENLRLSQGSGGGGQGQPGAGSSDDGDSSAGRAGDLIARQRELSDETFERNQSGEGSEGLSEGERGIGEDLDALIDELQTNGDDPDGEATNQLGRARNDIRQAEEALRNGDLGAAGSAMERAIDDLRGGAEALARNQRDQEQGGQGEGGGTQFDPAGRRVGEGRGEGVEVPEISEADRSRAIIDTIRKRLGKPGREDEEVEYLERLLDDF